MPSQNHLFLILICLTIIALVWVYIQRRDEFHLSCIISGVDGNKYCVRERTQLQNAADLLAKATQNCQKLVDYVGEKHGDDARVHRLVTGFHPQRIMEILPTSVHTAYSENKGEKIAFCLQKKREGDPNDLIDLHTLTFVAIHELSHVMTESIGHKKEFWDNFRFLLQEAEVAGIHQPIDYSKKPQEYCSQPITDNPYYTKA